METFLSSCLSHSTNFLFLRNVIISCSKQIEEPTDDATSDDALQIIMTLLRMPLTFAQASWSFSEERQFTKGPTKKMKLQNKKNESVFPHEHLGIIWKMKEVTCVSLFLFSIY